MSSPSARPRRRGAAPLMRADTRRVLVVLNRDLIRQLDAYGRRHDLPSRSFILRQAARELLARENVAATVDA